MTTGTTNGAPPPLPTGGNVSNSQCPFNVLGIALVVEEPGKGARLAFRYPVNSTSVESQVDDLFFTLSPRIMAKMFRPKKPLCGQPMTISVGGTVFCCRATLLKDDSKLDLFNIIVALAPTVPTSTIPISGWYDANNTEEEDYNGGVSNPSTSFLAIKRVHISIARLCRVLKREERTCHYVSLQSSQLLKIQETMRQEVDQRTKIASASNSVDASASEATNAKRRSHRRGLSGNTMAAASAAATAELDIHQPRKMTESMRFEVEQEILERLLATSPPSEQHYGNLAHELVQVYHALAWNATEFTPTPSILLSGSHGIIYINRHVAVCMEPASGVATVEEMPRPYQTLLFPHASPKELVTTLSTNRPNQRLQQLLLMVNPRKSLAEISIDAALPLATTLELAAFLVQQGACIVSSVVGRMTKLACTDTTRMQECALDFVQEFGVSIFIAVSVLTSNGMTLGECMSAAAAAASTTAANGGGKQGQNQDALFLGLEIIQWSEGASLSPTEIEEGVYSMAVWLRSHQVVVNMEEYLVAVGATSEGTIFHYRNDSSASADSWNAAVQESQQSENALKHPEEALYNELLDCLTGNVSTVALCWRYEIDPLQLHRFRSWGVLNNKLRVLARAPRPTDDWNTRIAEQ